MRSRPMPPAHHATRARSARRSARGSSRRTPSSLVEPDVARAAVLGAARRAEPEVEDGVGLGSRRGAHRRSLESRRGWISTERVPSATQTIPSCRLICSCMLRSASKDRARLCSEGTSQASTLPARSTRPARPAHQAGGVAAERVDADAVGAAARLRHAPLLRLADFEPVDDAPGQVLLPQLGLVGVPHALGELERAVALVGRDVERKREQPHHHPLVGLGRMPRERHLAIAIQRPVDVGELHGGLADGCFQGHRTTVP